MNESAPRRGRPPATMLLRSFSIACALLAFGLVLYQCALFGAGVSPDSVSYLVTAENLARGDGFVSWDGPYVKWPPVLPLLLSASLLLGVPATTAAAMLNAACLAGTVICAAFLLPSLVSSVFLRCLALACIATSPVLIDVAAWVWSEPLFMFLCMLALCLMTATDRDRRWWACAIAVAALAVMTRYVGFVVASVISCSLLFASRGSILTRVCSGLCFAILSAAPLAIWLLHNVLVAGTPIGARWPSMYTLATAFGAATITLGDWLLPRVLPGWFRWSLPAFIVLVDCVQSFLLWKRRDCDEARRQMRVSLSVLAFLVAYVGALTWLGSRVTFDPIGDRLMAPAFVPFLMLAFVSVDTLVSWGASLEVVRQRVLVGGAALILMAWYVVLPLPMLAKDIAHRHAEGAGGFATRDWRANGLIARLREADDLGSIYSNNPFAILALTEQEARFVPRRHAYRSPHAGYQPVQGALCRRGTDERVHVVWFGEGRLSGFLHPLDALQAVYDMDEIARRDSDRLFLVGGASRCMDHPTNHLSSSGDPLMLQAPRLERASESG